MHALSPTLCAHDVIRNKIKGLTCKCVGQADFKTCRVKSQNINSRKFN